MVKMKFNKFIWLALLTNIIENIILLIWFGAPVGKQLFIGAGVFGLTLFLLNKFLEYRI